MRGSRGRLLMVIDNAWPDTRVEREAQAAVRRGHRVDILCTGEPGEPRREVVDGLSIHRLPIARRRGMGAFVQLREYLGFLALATAKVAQLELRHHYHVVHVHNVPDFLVFTGIVPKLRGARVFLDVHDLTPEFFASRFGRGPHTWLGRAVRAQEWLSTRFADHVITVTDAWRDVLVRRGVPRAKTSVVMNVPDETVFRPMPSSARNGTSPFTVLYHGTLTHRYGVDILIEAVRRARERIPLTLVIHGTGEALAELERLAAPLVADGTVRFSTELLPTDALPELIAAADVGVVPNRLDSFTDGILPTKLLEYVAMDVPSVVARTSATAACFDDSMVRFFAPGDAGELAAALIELHDDPARGKAMAGRARAFLDQHSWTATADAYADLVDGPRAAAVGYDQEVR